MCPPRILGSRSLGGLGIHRKAEGFGSQRAQVFKYGSVGPKSHYRYYSISGLLDLYLGTWTTWGVRAYLGVQVLELSGSKSKYPNRRESIHDHSDDSEYSNPGYLDTLHLGTLGPFQEIIWLLLGSR